MNVSAERSGVRHEDLRGGMGVVAVDAREASDLRVLHDEVVRTRAAQHVVQRLPDVTPEGLRAVRRAHLKALETYARAVEGQGWPLSRKIRQDLHLQRSLCGTFDGWRSAR
jgi:hypothetical protein